MERKRLAKQGEALEAALGHGIGPPRHGREEEAGGGQSAEEGCQRAVQIRHIVQDMVRQHEIEAGLQVRGQGWPCAHRLGGTGLEPRDCLVPVDVIGFHKGEPQALGRHADAAEQSGGKSAIATPKIQHPDRTAPR